MLTEATAGLKCVECGGYNTVRDKGPLVRQPLTSPPPPLTSITPPLSPARETESDLMFEAPAQDSSVTMTPEPSPLRLEVEPQQERSLSMSLVSRRLDFDDPMEQ